MLCFFGQGNKLLFPVESGVIHYNNRICRQRRQKAFLKPLFKQGAVHGSVICQRRNNRLSHLRGNNTCSLIFAPANSSQQCLTTLRPAIFPIQVVINACFIHISNAGCRYVGYCLQVGAYFCRVLLLVAFGLFFRVRPSRFNALNMAMSEQPKASPISCK